MDRQAEFAALIERNASGEGITSTALPRLDVIKASKPSEPMHGVHQPAICILAQGRKQVILGGNIYFYDASRYLVVSVDVPIVGQVVDATPEEPYLSIRLRLDPHLISELILDAGLAGEANGDAGPSLSLSSVTPELLDAVIRMLRLLDNPRDIAVLGPLAEREILYRLLKGPDLMRLRQIAQADSKLQRVTRAISWIKQHFTEPFSIDALASEARMSASALHHHFKQVTAMSPLQYQKQLRLQEARRLILVQGSDAASAGHQVGYESPSQFSREYSRLFGAPPLRDANRLKATPEALMTA
ncbi:AraC family transcriptional regulator N-terminal domain-containing protein [Dongia sp.]|uniref:AraC family transcriptional regulator n=1 Tax=Dongia sp. TaxID=1977262 RepID=UPI0035B0FAA0